MEIGPTCHYVMGGVEVDAGHRGERASPACTPSASAPAACTAPTGSAATRCRTCWCSASGPARRRGVRPLGSGDRGPTVDEADVKAAQDERAGAVRGRGRREPVHDPERPPAVDERPGRHHPHRATSSSSRSRRSRSSRSGPSTMVVEGHRQYNPGWHLAIDLRNMLLVSRVHREGGAGPRRSRAAGTPATTSRDRTTSGARRTWCSRSTPSGDGVDLHREAAAGDARRAQEVLRGERERDGLRPEDARLARRPERRRARRLHRRGLGGRGRPRRASTGSRPPRPATSRSAGTARPASAARAAPRSTAGRGCCA